MTALVPGICAVLTASVVDSLRAFGIKTVADFITEDLEVLSSKSLISYKDLVAVRRVLLAQHSAYPVCGSDAYSSVCSSLAYFSMGCESLDAILDGGLYSGEVTEICGEIAAGKTQLSHCSAASVSGQSEQNVLYIDTCGAFCAERLCHMLQSQGKFQDPESVLSRVHCIQAYDIFKVFDTLEEIREELQKQTDAFYMKVKLIVVDSVTAVIYPVLGGQQMDGHGLMMQLGYTLKMLAVEFSLAVLITNNVVYTDGRRVASLGRSWSHVPHTRLVVEKSGSEGLRKATVIKSGRLKTPVSTSFQIPSEPD